MQTSMPSVGFEPTIPAFEQAKTVHALDLAVTVIGSSWKYYVEIEIKGTWTESYSSRLRNEVLQLDI
jgi:hypothetical protein